MTLETVIAELKVMFPKGIPNTASEVFAHQDAPVKSYQELRKLLGRSPAFTNRSNWKMLLAAAEKGGEVEPPKKLKDIVSNTTLSGFNLDQLRLQDFKGSELDAIVALTKLANPSIKDDELTSRMLSPLLQRVDDHNAGVETELKLAKDPTDSVAVSYHRVDASELVAGGTTTALVPFEDWSGDLKARADAHLARVLPSLVVEITAPQSSVVKQTDDTYEVAYLYTSSNVVNGSINVTLTKEPKTPEEE